MIFKIIYSIVLFFGATALQAEVSILTSTANLKAIAKEVGGSEVSVYNFCKGTQDPHFLEAKPSYMIKASRADLVISIGLGLEIGWLPKVLTGGRNPEVMPGKNGYLEVGPLLKVLEVPTGRITRADGDVHPEGNPHVTLDPIRLGTIAEAIAKRLGVIDPKHAAAYKQRAIALKTRLEQKTVGWKKRVAHTGIKKLVTYHKTFTYFIDRFGLTNPAILEPLPGVPPTGPHVLSVIKKMAAEGVKLIFVENYFDDSVAKRIAHDLKTVRVESVPVSVGGRSDIKTIDDLFENIVKTFEGSTKS